MNQVSFAKNLVAQYGISAKSNIPGNPGVDLGPRREGEQRVVRSFHSTELW